MNQNDFHMGLENNSSWYKNNDNINTTSNLEYMITYSRYLLTVWHWIEEVKYYHCSSAPVINTV